MENEKIIIDLLTEVRQDVKEQGKTLVKMQSSIERNADGLDEHMKRTKMLENGQKLHNARIEKLEEPGKFKKYFWNKYSKIGGIVSVTLSIGYLGIKYWDIIAKFITPAVGS